MDSGKVAAIHFFVRAGFEAVGKIVCRLGGRGQARGLHMRERLRGKGKTARVGDEGRGKDCACGDLMGLAGVGWRSSVGWGPVQYRHQVGEGCCRRGGVAGAEPPHKGGPNRPDRPKARRE